MAAGLAFGGIFGDFRRSVGARVRPGDRSGNCRNRLRISDQGPGDRGSDRLLLQQGSFHTFGNCFRPDRGRLLRLSGRPGPIPKQGSDLFLANHASRMCSGNHRRLRDAAIRDGKRRINQLRRRTGLTSFDSFRNLSPFRITYMTKLIRHLIFWIVALGAALFPPSALADDKNNTAENNHLAPLERFAGEWTVHGKWSNGEELQARNVYEWGLGNKILRAKTFVKTDKGEYQRY